MLSEELEKLRQAEESEKQKKTEPPAPREQIVHEEPVREQSEELSKHPPFENITFEANVVIEEVSKVEDDQWETVCSGLADKVLSWFRELLGIGGRTRAQLTSFTEIRRVADGYKIRKWGTNFPESEMVITEEKKVPETKEEENTRLKKEKTRLEAIKELDEINLTSLSKDNEKLHKKNTSLKKGNNHLFQSNISLAKTSTSLEKENTSLKEKVDSLERENKILREDSERFVK